eukprot:TRINITY_DN42311_c0_g1_i1.p1 TRINITY_DN42311_c0_g1~~TRINITY_DN42311_c0_g1_i1.p1  ORF type:complete len:457 (+),score=60.42 TRINITY_DN42311_c0_g1_i1:185-1372(+)
MVLSGRGWRGNEIHSFLEKTETLKADTILVEDVEVMAVPVKGGYGEVAWVFNELSSGHTTLISTAGTPVQSPPVQDFIYLPLPQRNLQSAPLLDALNIAINEDWHVVLPLYASLLSFASTKIVQLIKKVIRCPVHIVSENEGKFLEFSSRIYEYLPVEDRDEITLPDRPCAVDAQMLHPGRLVHGLCSVRASVFVLLDPNGWEKWGGGVATKTRGRPVTLMVDSNSESHPSSVEGVRTQYVTLPVPSLRYCGSLEAGSVPAVRRSALPAAHTHPLPTPPPNRPYTGHLVIKATTDGRLSHLPSTANTPLWRLGKAEILFKDHRMCTIIKTDQAAARPWKVTGGKHPLEDPSIEPMLKKHKAAVAVENGGVRVVFEEGATKKELVAVKKQLDKVLL